MHAWALWAACGLAEGLQRDSIDACSSACNAAARHSPCLGLFCVCLASACPAPQLAYSLNEAGSPGYDAGAGLLGTGTNFNLPL